jgi:hypothetical protein
MLPELLQLSYGIKTANWGKYIFANNKTNVEPTGTCYPMTYISWALRQRYSGLTAESIKSLMMHTPAFMHEKVFKLLSAQPKATQELIAKVICYSVTTTNSNAEDQFCALTRTFLRR